jgi:hypothetical protein
MLMHKAKEAVANLKKYLKNDTVGLRLLDEVSLQINALRKQSASSQEKAESSQRTTQRQWDIAHAMSKANDALRFEVQQQKSISAQLTADNTSLTEQMAKLRRDLESLRNDFTPACDMVNPEEMSQPNSENPLVRDFRQFAAMFDLLRRDMRAAPRLLCFKRKTLPHSIYEITDIVRSVNGDDMAKLGRFVASMALFNVPCIIVATQNFTTARTEIKRMEREKLGLPFSRWFREKNVQRPTVDDEAIHQRWEVNPGL